MLLFRLQRCPGALVATAAAAAGLIGCGQAWGHASDRGHVLLLPTGHYLVGGAIAVGASFVLLAVVPAGFLDRLARWRLPLGRERIKGAGTVLSTLSFLLAVVLIAAGWLGSRDPLANPLPLAVWTLFWVALTILHGMLGNLWLALNPWRAPYLLASGSWEPSGRAWLPLPGAIGHAPAIVQFIAFAWFELIYAAPDDPGRLALAASAYWLFNFIAMLAFGYREWMRRGECFAVFFAMVSRLSMLAVERTARDRGARRWSVCLPGARLIEAEPLTPSAMAFLLLALASVSFDGLMRTFAWLAAIGINPLDFPGRTAVTGWNTAGLLVTWIVLMAGFVGAVMAGEWLAGGRLDGRVAIGRLVWSIIPISLAYHVAHYLTALLVDAQYAAIALSDPFRLGWDLLGLSDSRVSAGIASGHGPAWVLWNIQSAAIIGGHVLAVVIAHVVAHRLHGGDPSRTALSQFPLALMMVAYTVFGLWLLSTPAAG